MIPKFRMILASALALAAGPALGYEEAFVASADRDPAPTVVKVGEYSEGYALETPAPQRPQLQPVAVGGYTEAFIDTGAPASSGGVAARSQSVPARVAAKGQ